MICQNSNKNLKFLSEIMFFENFQSTINNLFNNAFVQFFVVHVMFSKINDILLNILHVTVKIEFIDFFDEIIM